MLKREDFVRAAEEHRLGTERTGQLVLCPDSDFLREKIDHPIGRALGCREARIEEIPSPDLWDDACIEEGPTVSYYPEFARTR